MNGCQSWINKNDCRNLALRKLSILGFSFKSWIVTKHNMRKNDLPCLIKVRSWLMSQEGSIHDSATWKHRVRKASHLQQCSLERIWTSFKLTSHFRLVHEDKPSTCKEWPLLAIRTHPEDEMTVTYRDTNLNNLFLSSEKITVWNISVSASLPLHYLNASILPDPLLYKQWCFQCVTPCSGTKCSENIMSPHKHIMSPHKHIKMTNIQSG